MNKKLNPNFSLKKLLLSALVAGPLAILPAPLWALPSTAATNLTTSSTSITYSGVLDGVAAGALNITAPDKSILTWQAFNINAADTITYLLPSTTASVLNNVAGGAISTIAGAINSNGNVYLLNPAGIVISQTAAINTGGFYASTVAEPSSFFTTTGTLNFTGNATADVVVQSDGSASPSIQALGTGNKITLAGRSVLVEGANLFGNVTMQSASTGKVNLAQTSTPNTTFKADGTVNAANTHQAGGAVNILKAAGSGGDLTIVSNGGSVSLTGQPVVPLVPALTLNPSGALSIAQPTIPTGSTGVGSGYAPSTTIALSIPAPQIRQSLNSLTTASTTVGTAATGYATTNAQGQITGYVLTKDGASSATSGSGYSAGLTAGAAGTGLVGGGVSEAAVVVGTITQAGFATNVAGALSVNTTGSTSNGAVTQGAGTSTSRLTVTGAATITTGTTSTSAAAANVTLGNAALSTLNLPLVGTVNVIESDGFAVGNAKVLPNAAAAVTLRAQAGNISMSSGAKVEIVPSTAVPIPNTSLTANAGGVSYTNVGDLRVTGLSTTTASAGVSSLTATGNVTITPNFSSPSLTVTTTGGTITTGNLSTTAGASNQVAATLTASGNISVGNVNTTGKIVINSTGGTITLGQDADGFMTTGAGLDLKAVGDITMTNQAALVTSGTDAKIASTAGSVTLKGGFAGGGAITAANNVTIGAPSATGKPTVSANTALDTSSILSKVTGGTTSNPAGLYAPNSTVPMTVTAVATTSTTSTTPATAPTTVATGYFTTNASGQISGTTMTEVGAGYTYANTINLFGTTPATNSVANPLVVLTADLPPANSVVANSALTVTATAGTVAVASPIVGTGAVTIVSGGALTVPSITAPNVSLESKTGSIAQTAAITASGNTSLKAGTSVSLDLAGNDFNNVVLTASPSGVTLKDANALILANGTNAAGNVTITSGAGLTGFTGTTTVLAPNVATTFGAATVSAGSVASVALTTTGTGYAANATIPVTFSAPPTQSPLGFVIANSATTTQNASGFKLGAVGTTTNGLQAVILTNPIGNGFVNGSEVPLDVNVTFTPNGTTLIKPTVVGIANVNGQIASVRVTNPGVGVTAANLTSITTAAIAPIASATATGNLVTNAAGQVTGLTVTDGGSGYLGSFSPRVTVATTPTIGTNATITPNVVGTAITYSATAPGGGFITAPVIAATASAPAFTTTIVNGAIATVTPIATGGVALGSASTDVIKVAGNLTLSSVGPVGSASNGTVTAKHSELTTVAANVAVVGNVSLNTLGANATFGVPTGGFGAAPAVSAAAVGGAIGTGTFSVTQNNSVNLGVTTAAILNAKSAAGDITNSGKLTTTGNSEFSAGSLFAPGVITLNDATNALGGTVSIINGKNVSVVGATTVEVGSGNQNGVVSGSIYVENSAALNLRVAGNGNLSVVSFKAGGAVTITDGLTNTDGLTLQNISNTANAGTVDVNALGPITLGSGIQLASTSQTTIMSTGLAASIKDSAPGISIFGPLTLSSGNDIAITNAGHSVGRVTMTSGLLGAASTNANITYQEGGSANLGAVTVTAGATTPGSLSVTSTGGSIFQGAGTITVPAVAGGTNTVSFSAPNGSVTLDLGGNSIAPAVALTASGNSTVRQSVGNLVLSNVAVTAGTFDALVGSALTPTAVTVTNGGSGYTLAPTFTFTGGGVDATGTTTLGTGALTSVVASGGAGYVTAPTVTISAPPAGGIQAVGTATIVAGKVTGVTFTGGTNNPGAGYTTSPTVTFTGGGFTTASTGIAIGALDSVATVTYSVGSGYLNPAVSALSTVLGATAAKLSFTGTTVAGAEIQQAAGSTVRVFGDTNLKAVGKITLDNAGNNFGGLTIASTGANTDGAAVALKEGGTINLKSVNTGAATTSTLKLTSEGGSIVSSATALATKNIAVGGATTLVSAADVALNTTDVSNNLGGQSITITAPGSVSIQDKNLNTVIAGGSTIGGTLTVKNDATGASTIKDSAGALTVNGNVFLQTTSTTGSINIGASTATLGAIQFRSGNVSIAEATTLNLAAGSTSTTDSVVQLSSGGDIVTSGLGGGSFGGSLSLNANGSITVSNPIYVATGLTFRALGAVNLSALSQTGNLSGRAPTNLGAASYVAPSP